ncbi:MAG: ribose-phosphate pyrophosphokinase [Chloroflexi bacterium]|nr:ribose-phosphate pyrophosphokinase [Chloroflexota bacterium]
MYGELAIFSGRANPQLAKEIADYLKVPLREAEVSQFPNENIFVQLHKSVRSQDVFLIQPTCSPVSEHIMELLIFIDTLRRDSAGRITAVIPYYAYGRTDKKDQPRVPITARLLADMISVAGADRFLTIDLHAGQIQGFFTIPVDEITAFHLLVDYFQKKRIPNAVAVAPDIGASKKARNFAEKLDIPLAIIEKRRAGTQAQVLSLIGEVKGKNAIIFDDEVDTATTLTEAVQLLKDKGSREVYACVTHAVLSDPATERLRAAPLKELVVTNTIPIPPHKELEKMTVLSVGPLLGEVIRRIHLGISVGEMFGE